MRSVGDRSNGFAGGSVTRRNGEVEFVMSELGARRLMLALGMNTARYGPEVATLLEALCKLLLGMSTGAVETSHPHGEGCTCGFCQEVFRG